MILECQAVGRYQILGGTLDDALGEAYDKAARLLGVGSGAGGGPAMEALAREGDPKAVPLPVPMKGKKNLNFSYAGLKNAFRMVVTRMREEGAAVVNSVEGEGGGGEGEGNQKEQREFEMDAKTKADLAASFQHVAIQHLEERLERAMVLSEGKGIRTLAVVGGVAANQAIRARLSALCAKRTDVLQRRREEGEEGEAEKVPAWELVVPPPRLCTDNGVMVAWAAIEKLRCGFSDVIEGQDVFARWPFKQQQQEMK